ncbi:MAG TPA: response regulator FixJ [Xanthobacteraceae bacterium]|uniref:response regulator FixJ n=1 Tax=Roseixanthobacter finlandensis TaxID=3119922 RepID=UPI000BCCA4ED|nr:MAG: DNA-binding response regulator [Rhizobiales bacterium 12-66-7]HQS10627.1 response regulator FixJ [Xanthobacteraceae bacterium]
MPETFPQDTFPKDALPIHIIDDDDAVRDSLCFLLECAGFKVQAHPSAGAFIDGGVPASAGCIITDVRMPGLSGVELLQYLNTRGSKIPVIVVTGHGDVPLAVEAMKLGAAEFLEKPFDDDALLAAVHTCLTQAALHHHQDAVRSDVEERIAALSQREHQVLELLLVGHANKVIAQDLGISPRTVEVYRANVMTKMKAASLSELVRMALIAGVGGPVD